MRTKRITFESARKICVVSTLAKLGYLPSRNSEKEAWYLSPLRTETQASFKVSVSYNRWYDFGIGKGGDVIDLVCMLTNCSLTEALDFLSDDLPNSIIYQDNELERANRKKTSKNKILRITQIKHPQLIKYLLSRKIPIGVARAYCREIWFECNAKKYFALGLENNLGGWELRNLYSKTSTSPKSYSFVKNNKQDLIVMEGMFDLLSLAVISPEKTNEADVLILNSLSFISNVLPLFENYKTVSLYLDRDAPGEKTVVDIISKNTNCEDKSFLYEGFKDLNDMLISSAYNGN